MQPSTKVMTVMATMVAAFTILPMLTAVAAEPLDDGTYTVSIEDRSYRLHVLDGRPSVDASGGVEWFFEYDDEQRVLDEFHVVVAGVAYEVEVGENGQAFAMADRDGFSRTRPTSTVAGPATVDRVQARDVPADSTDAEQDADDAEQGADDAGQGDLVSAVAACLPSERPAREAGLPPRGILLSAVATGRSFTVAGRSFSFGPDMTAGEICAEAAMALQVGAQAAADADADGAPGGDGKPPRGPDEVRDGRGSGPTGEAPGRSKGKQQD